jgi:glucose-1-phosphate thymidylyltransferase
MDCNKAVTVETNSRMLGFLEEEAALVAVNVRIDNSTIIPPCYIGRCVFNQFHCRANVSLGKDAMLQGSTIKNSLIQTHAHISNANLDNAMGNHVYFVGDFTSISIGDYSVLE